MPKYVVEYAKSNRSTCSVCKSTIGMSSLRLGVLTPSPFHDGEICKWRHLRCMKTKIPTVSEVQKLLDLNPEDQVKVMKICMDGDAYLGGSADSSAGSSPSTESPDEKSGDAPETSAKPLTEAPIMPESCTLMGIDANTLARMFPLNTSTLQVEPAKSGRSTCAGCGKTIPQGSIRMGYKVMNYDIGFEAPEWMHLPCFFVHRGTSTTPSYAEGFSSLSVGQRRAVRDEWQRAVLKKALSIIKDTDADSAVIVRADSGEPANAVGDNATALTPSGIAAAIVDSLSLYTESAVPKGSILDILSQSAYRFSCDNGYGVLTSDQTTSLKDDEVHLAQNLVKMMEDVTFNHAMLTEKDIADIYRLESIATILNTTSKSLSKASVYALETLLELGAASQTLFPFKQVYLGEEAPLEPPRGRRRRGEVETVVLREDEVMALPLVPLPSVTTPTGGADGAKGGRGSRAKAATPRRGRSRAAGSGAGKGEDERSEESNSADATAEGSPGAGVGAITTPAYESPDADIDGVLTRMYHNTRYRWVPLLSASSPHYMEMEPARKSKAAAAAAVAEYCIGEVRELQALWRGVSLPVVKWATSVSKSKSSDFGFTSTPTSASASGVDAGGASSADAMRGCKVEVLCEDGRVLVAPVDIHALSLEKLCVRVSIDSDESGEVKRGGEAAEYMREEESMASPSSSAASSTTVIATTPLLSVPGIDITTLRAFAQHSLCLGAYAPVWAWARCQVGRDNLLFALWANALNPLASDPTATNTGTTMPITADSTSTGTSAAGAGVGLSVSGVAEGAAIEAEEKPSKGRRGKGKGKGNSAATSSAPPPPAASAAAVALPADYPEPLLSPSVRAALGPLLEKLLNAGARGSDRGRGGAASRTATSTPTTASTAAHIGALGGGPGGSAGVEAGAATHTAPEMSLRDAMAAIGEDRRAITALDTQLTQARISMQPLKTLLLANGLEKLSHGMEAHVHGAELLYRGLYPPCPVCGQQKIKEEHGMYVCSAYVDPFTPCYFTAEYLDMLPPYIPDELKESYPFFRKYVFTPHPPPLVALRVKAKHEQRTWAEQDLVAAERIRASYLHRRAMERRLGGDPTEAEASGRGTGRMSRGGDGAGGTIEGDVGARVIVKGRVAVSDCCDLAYTHHVVDPGAYTVIKNGREKVRYHRDIEPYSVTLVATDILNNRNSYVKLQLLKRDDAQVYVLQKEWGRVGTSAGGANTHTYGALSTAVAAFCSEFHEKSGNEWGVRPYLPHRGYLYPVSSEGFAEEEEEEDGCAPCSLPERITRILERIFNKAEVTRTLRALRLDTSRLPAGKLTVERVKEGYECLGAIDQLLRGAWATVDAENARGRRSGGAGVGTTIATASALAPGTGTDGDGGTAMKDEDEEVQGASAAGAAVTVDRDSGAAPGSASAGGRSSGNGTGAGGGVAGAATDENVLVAADDNVLTITADASTSLGADEVTASPFPADGDAEDEVDEDQVKAQQEQRNNTLPPLPPRERATLIGLNNRFFTLIPHHLGSRQSQTFHDPLVNPMVVGTLARVMEESRFLESLLNVAATVSAIASGNVDAGMLTLGTATTTADVAVRAGGVAGVGALTAPGTTPNSTNIATVTASITSASTATVPAVTALGGHIDTNTTDTVAAALTSASTAATITATPATPATAPSAAASTTPALAPAITAVRATPAIAAITPGDTTAIPFATPVTAGVTSGVAGGGSDAMGPKDTVGEDYEDMVVSKPVKRGRVDEEGHSITVSSSSSSTVTCGDVSSTVTTSTTLSTTSTSSSTSLSATTATSASTSTSAPTSGGDTIPLHPLDRHYRALNASLHPLPHDSREFGIIREYLSRTHAPTHDEYTLDLLDVIRVEREGEQARYDQAISRVQNDIYTRLRQEKEGKRVREEDISSLLNRQLLWHGTRTANVAGILQSGLKIAPTTAIITGKMFGEAIYLADMASKSANYTFCSRDDTEGFMFLCEAVLGNTFRRVRADYITELPHGYHSTYGVGAMGTAKVQHTRVDEDVLVPVGDPVDNMDLKEALLEDITLEYVKKREAAITQYENKMKTLAKRRMGKEEREKLSENALHAHELKLQQLQAKEEEEKKKVHEDKRKGSLLYNEYMVYKEDQVRIRYLINVKFNFRSRGGRR